MIDVSYVALPIRYVAVAIFLAGVVYTVGRILRRPATALLIRRSAQLIRTKQGGCSAKTALRTLIGNIALQTYIYKRGRVRWLTHFTLFVGGLGLVIFHGGPRIFLGLTEEQLFPTASLELRVISHDAFLVLLLLGTGSALARRFLVRDVVHPTTLANVLPLVSVVAVAVSGIVAFQLEYLYAYEVGIPPEASRGVFFLVHAVIVYGSLMALFFTKFLHWGIRVLAFHSEIYANKAATLGTQKCVMCGKSYAPVMQVEDVASIAKKVDKPLAFHCPECKRKMKAEQLARASGVIP